MTRQQVSTFKIKFRRLMDFINKKGGINVINNLPNENGQPSSKNEMIQNSHQREMTDLLNAVDNSGMQNRQSKGIDLAQQVQDHYSYTQQRGNIPDNVSDTQSVKKIRGGQQSHNQPRPTIRGGGGGRQGSIIMSTSKDTSGPNAN